VRHLGSRYGKVHAAKMISMVLRPLKRGEIVDSDLKIVEAEATDIE
jgi:hypothetical protein